MISRRNFLKGMGALVLGGVAFSGYAFGVEPLLRLRVQPYHLQPAGWPDGLTLRIAVLADIHACDPWMTAERIRRIAEQTNALSPDIILLLGDYSAGHRWVTRKVASSDWSQALAELSAPMGVHAILGNHDWWDDLTAQERGHGPVYGHKALQNVGINVYENDVVRLEKDGIPFWLAGLGDQLAFPPNRGRGLRHWQGVDDLPGTLEKITDDAPIILMAHEPDIFPNVPERVCLTLSGHTHGGQIRLFGYSPVVPSRYKNRYAYGHIVETASATTEAEKPHQNSRPRHLIVSGGLGCSMLPVRFGVPPEIVQIDIG
ncbi:MAG: metallophosphoesterase [Stappiaceae bacterium]